MHQAPVPSQFTLFEGEKAVAADSSAPATARGASASLFDAGGQPSHFTPTDAFLEEARAHKNFLPNRSDCGKKYANGWSTVSGEDVELLSEPRHGAKPLVDEKGSPRLLDPRFDLRIVERKADWVHVLVSAPAWPPGGTEWSGWIEAKHIQTIASPDEKACLFVDAGRWTSVSQEKIGSMRAAALRILREDDRCSRIARGGMIAAGQRFYFTCYPTDGGRPYHYWLSLLTEGRSFKPPPPVDEDGAVNLCRQELFNALRNLAAIQRTPVRAEPRITGFSIKANLPLRYISIDYQLGEELRQADCFLAPGQKAEISLK